MLTVSIPVEIQDELRVALTKSGSNECGGILMGEHTGHNQFVIRRLTIQGGGTFASFVRNTRGALKALKEYFQGANKDYKRFNYLGEWHSHPSFSVQPSGQDHRSMIEIATNPAVGANFVVLMVVKLAKDRRLEGSVHTYLPDGSYASSSLVFEGAS